MHTTTLHRRLLTSALGMALTACFVEPSYSSDQTKAGTGTTQIASGSSDGSDAPAGGTDGDNADAGPLPDPGDGSTDGNPGNPATGTGAPEPVCGDGIVDGDEACDDGNTLPGDGCSAACGIETTGCAPAAAPIAEDLATGVAVCSDPTFATCEEDFATLCAPGWHLCTGTEHRARALGWSVDLDGHLALGAIRCRAPGGAGHYTVSTMSAMTPDNCQVGSSRPECPSELGCNETDNYALCCDRIPTCGDGHLDPPLEECDDPDSPQCSPACASLTAAGPYC